MNSWKGAIAVVVFLGVFQVSRSGPDLSSFRPGPSKIPEQQIPLERDDGRIAFPVRSVLGTATTYGDGFDGLFALPQALGGRGVHVRICNVKTLRCVTRTSNDVGPEAWTHRVADLDTDTFEFLCGCNWHQGTQIVTVEFLR